MTLALYLMKFVGVDDFGGGALLSETARSSAWISPISVQGHLYRAGRQVRQFGHYEAPTGATLVTGQQLPAGAVLKLTTDWPMDFANGQPHALHVEGRPVQVTFEKIDDVE